MVIEFNGMVRLCANKAIGMLFPSLSWYGERYIDTKTCPVDNKNNLHLKRDFLIILFLSFDVKTRSNECRNLLEKLKEHCRRNIAQEADARLKMK